MDLTTVEGALSLAEMIVNALLKEAPIIEQGIASSAPYVEAMAGLIKGSNATQDQIDALLLLVNQGSASFQRPLPPDDGSTTT